MQRWILLPMLILKLTPPQAPASKWDLIKQDNLSLGGSQGATVQLLRSSQQTGQGGAQQELFDVQLLVVLDGKPVFDFVKDLVGKAVPADERYYMRDILDLKDFTRDGIPEVLFRSGSQGAFDFLSRVHVLHFNSASNSFTDVAPSEFFESGTHDLRLLSIGNRELVVVAKRGAWPASTPPDGRCRYCESYFAFDAYEWNATARSFDVVRRFNSRNLHHDASEAFEEWSYVQSTLSK